LSTQIDHTVVGFRAPVANLDIVVAGCHIECGPVAERDIARDGRRGKKRIDAKRGVATAGRVGCERLNPEAAIETAGIGIGACRPRVGTQYLFPECRIPIAVEICRQRSIACRRIPISRGVGR